MDTKFLLVAFLAFALAGEALAADATKEEKMEDSTESPIADLAVIDAEVKPTTERPPTAAATASKDTMMAPKNEQKQNAQPHTVADFIIHPLIAFKPRAPEDSFAGKQAGASSSTTPSPWSIFGFNAGQGLGSSVTSLAGSVSGWLNDRIQLPGLVESPIRDPSSNDSSSTTTTTPRPDVVVRVQHRASTRRPLIAINNRNRPQNFQNNNNFASDEYDEEYDEEDEFVNNNKRRKNNKNQNNRRKPNRPQVEDEEEDSVEEEVNRPLRRPQQNQAPQKRRRRPFVEDDFSDEQDDDDEQSAEQEDDVDSESDENNDVDDETFQRPNKRRLVAQNNNKRRRLPQQQQWRPYAGNQRRRVQKPAQSEDDDEDDDEEVQFYYGIRPSTKRSQNEASFFQRGQDNIINQIRQLTRGYTPAEIGSLVSKPSSTQQGSSKKKRRQQATLLVNRNGQTIYLAPELLNVDLPLVNTQVHHVSQNTVQAPKPPLSVPLKQKDAPTQYITIPWSQLGISPPDQLHSVTEGVQTQPLILNIPASALQTMQNQSLKRKKQPVITAEAVPLLAEASIVDVFKPPTFPNDRHTAEKPSSSATPVTIASKKKTSTNTKSSVLPQRIRPGTIVEKAPASADSQQEDADDMTAAESVRNVEKQYILVGEDADPGLGRHVQPVFGDARYVYGAKASPYVGLLRRGQFTVRRSGREVDTPKMASEEQGVKLMPNGEKLIPVQIISEPEMVEQKKETRPALLDTQPQKDTPPMQLGTQTQKEMSGAQSELQKEVAHKTLEGASVSAQKAQAA